MAEDFETERLQGSVADIIYRNDQTGYCVARIRDDCDNIVTAVGNMPFLGSGEYIDAQGSYTSHPQYGRQFSVRSYERFMPSDTQGIFDYLASGGIKGIGVKTAQLIVEKFGERSFEIIGNDPEKLATIRGISPEKAYRIQREFLQAGAMRALIEFLSFHRLPAFFAAPLLSSFGGDAIEELTHDPYILCKEPYSLPFSAADELGAQFGIGKEDNVRLDAAILFELSYNLGNGHVFIPTDKLLAVSASLSGISEDTLSDRLPELQKRNKIVLTEVGEKPVCYLHCAFYWETTTVREVRRLIDMQVSVPRGLKKKLEHLQQKHSISLAPLQKEAVLSCFESGISIITGGPGTGKTTTLLTVVELLEQCGYTYLLAAPTGRAADRMSKICSHEAFTLHRMLESIPNEQGEMTFRRNSGNPLPADVIIVDEASMMDLYMSSSLLAALRPHARLVLVGDADQLPPVGAGRFFKDLLDSGEVPAVHLTEIFRQAQNSDIVMNAHAINRGEVPPLHKNSGDFYFSAGRTAQSVANTVCELISRRIPEHFGIQPADIQVICPSRRNTCGTEELNILLQSVLNPPCEGKGETAFGRVVFRKGDRVMQIKNNYDRTWQNTETREIGAGIYNGDTGIIESVDTRSKFLIVRFDTRLCDYAFAELSELEHAFAVTVHKSQGSEYGAVIIPLFDAPPRLLSRNLLYTAVTRARELLVIVGREDMVEHMTGSVSSSKRYSALKRRLRANAK